VWSIVVIIGAVTLALVVARLLAVRRSSSNLLEEVGVTLSILPTRTALVMLDPRAGGSSAAVAPVVEHAVSEAFAFESVDVVEVRTRDGQLLDRRRRRDVISA
jgi:hypothetical protein